jgi:Tfp pilus assembly protein PilN
MKAVNLIPADAPAGGRSSSGAGAYGLLAVLALLVALSAVYTLAGRTVAGKERELAAATAQATATEAQAASLKTYADFANMRKARVETVKNLVDSRFDWAPALREVARTLPRGTWVTSLAASTTPAANPGGTVNPLRAALAVPAIDLAACAPDQAGVARAITSLRRITGVQRVSLSNSQKAQDSSGGGDSAGDSAGGCGSGRTFGVTIFFEAKTSSSSTTAAAPGAATGATTP